MTGSEAEVDRVFVIGDLAGYTALTEAMGAREAANVVTRFATLAEQALRPGASLVEQVGDEVLIAAADAVSAVRTALAPREAVGPEPLFSRARFGVHGGPVVDHRGRYFGPALNLTARVAAHARGGQVLCTGRIAGLVTLPGVEYRAIGPARFRNVTGDVPLFEIVRTAEPPSVRHIDPVCRMQVDPESAPARLPFGGATYHFCSFECARRFAERPEDYAGVDSSSASSTSADAAYAVRKGR